MSHCVTVLAVALDLRLFGVSRVQVCSCRILQCVAVCCSVLQCVAARCSTLQRVAVRCSALSLGMSALRSHGE